MDFSTDLEHDNEEYKLTVRTSSDEPSGDEPKSIYVSVDVSKREGDTNKEMETFLLKYDTSSREYAMLSKIRGKEDPFYLAILQTLDATYGDEWGFTAN